MKLEQRQNPSRRNLERSKQNPPARFGLEKIIPRGHLDLRRGISLLRAAAPHRRRPRRARIHRALHHRTARAGAPFRASVGAGFRARVHFLFAGLLGPIGGGDEGLLKAAASEFQVGGWVRGGLLEALEG